MRTLRIDHSVLSTENLQSVLKKYADKGKVSYCFVEERGTETGKLHNQGWFIPIDKKADTAILKHFSRILDGTAGSTKSLELAHEPINEVAYILNNSEKPKPSFSDCYTSHTESEILELQERKRFVELRARKLKTSGKCRRDVVFDYIEEHCVIDGVIQYELIPIKYLDMPPSFINVHRFFDTCQSLALRLENKYSLDKNKRTRKSLYNGLVQMDKDGIFSKKHTFDFFKDSEL